MSETKEQVDQEGETDFLKLIQDADAVKDAAARNVERVKERLKQAKAAYEEAILDVHALVAESRSDQLPLFRKSKVDDPERVDEPEPDEPEAGDDAGLEFEDWEKVELMELMEFGMLQAAAEKMKAAGIVTLGDLAEFEKKSELTDLKGIGVKAEVKIKKALESFWEAYPDEAETNETNDGQAEVAVDPADGDEGNHKKGAGEDPDYSSL